MTIAFQVLDDLPIGITGEMAMKAFEPFVCKDAEANTWRRLAWKNRRRALGRLGQRILGTGTRNTGVIKNEYEGTWARGYEAYNISLGCRKPEPWHYRGQSIVADRAGTPRLRHVLLSAVIRALAPKRVLEVGCGNGINLLLLAGAFPATEFTGIELTEAGNRIARGLQTSPELPAALSQYGTAPPLDPTSFRHISFLQGDATQMPFADNHFDLVFSVLSVEQMEQVHDQALTEIARVSGGHVLNLEPFAEMNRTIWRRMHVYSRDYFRGTIAGLSRYGLEPIWATSDYPQEELLGTALVLSKKQPVPELN